MILYHINKAKYSSVWPPEGTLHAEGRWNKAGQWIIYSSPTISLAKLEILANESLLPIKRVCFTIEVADQCVIYKVETKELPKNWMNKPYPSGIKDKTSTFLKSRDLLMQVPSAQSYSEHNYLINVRHPDFHSNVKLLEVSEEPFDPRLCNGG